MSALSYAAAQLFRVLPRDRLSRAAGRLAEHAWSPALGRAVVSLYSKAYRVELGDCESEAWPSFDAFFTRALRPGMRAIDPDPLAVICPADGRLDTVGAIEEGSTFLVKGQRYSVAELLADAAEAERYAGGLCAVIYLSPRDYHRVHAPVSGYVRRIVSTAGDYYPVNDTGVRHVPRLLVRNRRVAISIDTAESSGVGRVGVVMVAAMIVGRITVSGVEERDVPFGDHFFDPPRPVERGQELGMFHLGSTTVVLLEKAGWRHGLLATGPVRLGQRLARLASPATQPAFHPGRGAA